MAKLIFITGGVVSSLGKGVAISSIAALLQGHGYRVRLKKLDPYFNIDPGTMSPLQHGEVFVTNDGMETDMDIGHYERFTGVTASASDSITSGKIYAELLSKERKGDYLGHTVQVIPHVTDLIKKFILQGEEDVDIMLCEIGGTVGDIEALPYLEAIRQLFNEREHKDILSIHLTLIPYLNTAKEFKTKPTQHSVKELRSIGIQPSIILCRGEESLSEDLKRKISLFCNISQDNVVQSQDVDSIYSIPLLYHSEKLDKKILTLLDLKFSDSYKAENWVKIAVNKQVQESEVNVAIIGKYDNFQNSYKSLTETLEHCALNLKCKVNLLYIDVHKVSDSDIQKKLALADGVIVPGGFGDRGVDKMMNAIKFAREQDLPLLGICLGFQLVIIEYARNVLGLVDANSTEFTEDCTNIIDLRHVAQLQKGEVMGGSMRLGSYKCALRADSKVRAIYGDEFIEERHRHRYEFNDRFKEYFKQGDLFFSGVAVDGECFEIIESKTHKWFIAVQFHPEYKSSPFVPHPLFMSFIRDLK
jgi:CTP synthase